MAYSCWWKGDDEDIIVYTEDIKYKPGIRVMASYSHFKNGKKLAFQYKVTFDSKEYKKLFKDLTLTVKDEWKPSKKTRKKKGVS